MPVKRSRKSNHPKRRHQTDSTIAPDSNIENNDLQTNPPQDKQKLPQTCNTSSKENNRINDDLNQPVEDVKEEEMQGYELSAWYDFGPSRHSEGHSPPSVKSSPGGEHKSLDHLQFGNEGHGEENQTNSVTCTCEPPSCRMDQFCPSKNEKGDDGGKISLLGKNEPLSMLQSYGLNNKFETPRQTGDLSGGNEPNAYNPHIPGVSTPEAFHMLTTINGPTHHVMSTVPAQNGNGLSLLNWPTLNYTSDAEMFKGSYFRVDLPVIPAFPSHIKTHTKIITGEFPVPHKVNLDCPGVSNLLFNP